jgi:hypothetical protein
MTTVATGELRAYIEKASAADQPRDIVHLGTQELVASMAIRGGWTVRPEFALDDAAVGSRSADLVFERSPGTRPQELALIEVYDWLDDVGAAFRGWDRKVAKIDRIAVSRLPPGDDDADPILPVVSGFWVLRATLRNRELVRAHRTLFAARFTSSGRAWLEAVQDPAKPMPRGPAVIWVAVRGHRLWSWRP